VDLWGPSHGPEGGSIAGIAVDPEEPFTLYAGAFAGGVFKSTNGGESWRALDVDPAGAFRGALAIDPRRSGTLYVGTGRGVFKSVDAGETWRLSSAGLFGKEAESEREWRLVEGWVTRLVVDPRNSKLVYAATYGGVAKSADGARTWRRLNAGLTVTFHVNGRKQTRPRLVSALALDPSQSRTIYAGTEVFGVFKGPGVFKSTNGGRRWRPAGLPGRSVHALVVDPGSPKTLYAATSEGLFKSTDRATSWRALPPSDSINFLTLRPEGIYAGTSQGVLTSLDGGESWQRVGAGFEGASISNLAIDPESGTVFYAGTSAGVYKSTDGAHTWHDVNRGLTATGVASLALDAEASRTIYARTWGSGLFRSVDSGGSWQSINNGLPSRDLDAVAVDPRDGTVIYAAVRNDGIFKSTDAGASWRALGLRAEFVNAIAIDPHDSRILYTGTGFPYDNQPSGAVFKSVDGGDTWIDTGLRWPPAPNVIEPERPPVTELAVDPQHPLNVYAGTTRGVFKSTDEGRSWRLINSGLTGATPFGVGVRTLALDPADPKTIYVATYEGVFRSTNGGERWEAATGGLPDRRYVATLAVNPRRPNEIYAGTFGDAGAVFVSTDRGHRWQPFSPGLRGHAVLGLAIDRSGRLMYAATFGRGVLDFTFDE
jgi:photosystem II stability/assembly factor-like uncharacterized protein